MSNAGLPVIPVDDLRAVVNLILDHIVHDLKIDAVPIEENKDFYWDMERKYLYDVQNRPPELDVGRLSDDWGFVTKMSGERREAVALMLVHAAPLLRYIGEKIGQ